MQEKFCVVRFEVEPHIKECYNAVAPDLIPGWGRSPGEGNGNPLQYSCLENPMDRGYSPWGRQESDST